uniref:SPRY domain-containing protein n=1 Tax=Parascaris univalens TaxID=6257 RepID=A0A915A9V0_PARUN
MFQWCVYCVSVVSMSENPMLGCCFPPLRMCLECVQGPSFTATQSYTQFHDELQSVRLDTSYMGDDVVLLKNGQRICGSGGALATAPIVQNKAYFQVSLQQSGVWGVGVANRSVNLNSVPISANSWVLRHTGEVVANGEVVDKLLEPIEEGDCIGVAFDHVDLKFYKNGVQLPVSISNVRGQVFPLVYVDDSAILDAIFRLFSYNAPPGYEEIMLEQTLL